MKAIMLLGTLSRSGKSLLVTALSRILVRQGWRVGPFKAQTCGVSTYFTSSGGEIGYAQAVQAWAAQTLPRVDMNPIVLKLQDAAIARVVFAGKTAIGEINLSDYYPQHHEAAWRVIQDALHRLKDEFDVLVCEGEGTPSELPIKPYDVSNFRVAQALDAAVFLVVDLERDGAFAQVLGTLETLEPDERSRVAGLILNKAHGSRSLLQSTIQHLVERTGIPVVGTIPYLDQTFPAIESLSLIDHRTHDSGRDVNISIIKLPRISNLTDFDPLRSEASVALRYVGLKETLGYPDAVIIPGSKSTIADLLTLQRTGMAEQLQNYAAAGGTVLGICGGFQMMGKLLADPEGIEGQEGRFKGLGLIPLKTVITSQKTARQRSVTSNYPQAGLPVVGYEFCQGRSHALDKDVNETDESPFTALFDDRNLGVVDNAQLLWGTHLHGLFDNGPWRRTWLNRLRQQRGLSSLPTGISNYREQREMLLDAIADVGEAYLDLGAILASLGDASPA
ncbi:MAG TPA: cobyric acid synthase CobQ [Candidatus Obscuribacterales bacterium]